MVGVSPETCWASYKHWIINFDALLHLVGYFCMNYKLVAFRLITHNIYGKVFGISLLWFFLVTVITHTPGCVVVFFKLGAILKHQVARRVTRIELHSEHPHMDISTALNFFTRLLGIFTHLICSTRTTFCAYYCFNIYISKGKRDLALNSPVWYVLAYKSLTISLFLSRNV